MNAIRSLQSKIVCICIAVAALSASNCFAVKLSVDITAAPYSADPTGTQDASPAFQKAITNMNAAGGGYLFIPDGIYRFNSLVSLTNGGANCNLCIQGQSKENTILRSYNTNGIFGLNYLSGQIQVTVQKLTFMAKAQPAGTAFSMTTPSAAGPYRGLTMDDITITNSVYNYFKEGIVADSICRPIFTKCSFSGVPAASCADDSVMFNAERGFDLVDCYASVFMDCSVANAEYGFSLYGGSTNIEDGVYYGCKTDNVKVALDHYQVGMRASLWVVYCNFRARDYGAMVYGRSFFMVSDNTFQQLSHNYPVEDTYLQNDALGIIRSNTYASANGSLEGGRKNIHVANDGTVLLSKKLLLISNDITGTNTTEAITVDAGAVNIQQVGNF